MKNKKVTKTILNILISFLFFLSIYILIFDITLSHLPTIILIPLSISVGNIFYNIFEYEKFDSITIKDFLNSKHKITINNTNENWEKLRTIINLQFKPIKLKIKEDNKLVYLVSNNILESELTFEKEEDEINILIKKRYISFLPDRANNYQIIDLFNKQFNN
jgi:hypothetical protein